MESSVVSMSRIIVFFNLVFASAVVSHDAAEYIQSDTSIAAILRGNPTALLLKNAFFQKQSVMMQLLQTKCFTVCVLVMLVAISCITRNNPFDPVNQPSPRAGVKTIVNDKDSLMNKAFTAKPGDTIVLAAGTYPVSLRFGNSGTIERPIVIVGTDSSSVVRAQPGQGILYISGQHSLRLSHIVFDSSFASGAKIENGSTDIVFSDCVFLDNVFDGLEITDSDVRVTNCKLLRNTKAGIRISGDATARYTVTADNVLCAHNTQEGVVIVAAPASITRSTISDNGGSGIAITSPAGAVRVAASIISFNAGAGIYGQWDSAAAQITLDSLDLFSNQQAITLVPVLAPAYWAWDPMFSDRNTDNYSIGAASEIYNMERQGIVIGFRK
jgi:hypothetical protein